MAQAPVDPESVWKQYQQNVCNNIAGTIKNHYNPKIDKDKVAAEAFAEFETKRGQQKYEAYWSGKTYEQDYNQICVVMLTKYIIYSNLAKAGLARPTTPKKK